MCRHKRGSLRATEMHIIGFNIKRGTATSSEEHTRAARVTLQIYKPLFKGVISKLDQSNPNESVQNIPGGAGSLYSTVPGVELHATADLGRRYRLESISEHQKKKSSR